MNELKLTIELIPSTAWFNNLRNMVGQKKWDDIRKKCYREANYRCEICGGTGNKWPVECHEKWEFVDNKIILKGFIALCPSCHEVKHIGLASVRGRFKHARTHFIRVNKVKPEVADQYIEQAFQLYKERSNEQWELCIDSVYDYLN